MKKLIIFLFISFWAKVALTQENIGDCMKNTFRKPDSVAKLRKNLLEEWKNCALNKPMSNFIATTFSGDTIEMNKFKGKVVVINFWFIGCPPCITELPGLNKLAEEYKAKEVVFLAITKETVKKLEKDFFPHHKLDFVVIPDAQQLIDKIAGSGYPTTYIINRQGIIKKVWSGGSVDIKAGDEYYEKAKPVIDELLKAE